MALLVLTSCGQDDEPVVPEETPEAATVICDGILTGAAARYLEDFASGLEMRGTAYYGDGSPDLESYLRILRDSPRPWWAFCDIEAPMDDNWPFASFMFDWAESVPSEEDIEPDLTLDTGEFAYVEDGVAKIYFHCQVGLPDGDYLMGHFGTTRAVSTPAHMTIANTASRAVAEGLGCLEVAGLQAGEPQVVGE